MSREDQRLLREQAHPTDRYSVDTSQIIEGEDIVREGDADSQNETQEERDQDGKDHAVAQSKYHSPHMLFVLQLTSC